jgi:hypothetical protein
MGFNILNACWEENAERSLPNLVAENHPLEIEHSPEQPK